VPTVDSHTIFVCVQICIVTINLLGCLPIFLQAVAWKAAVWEFVGIICIAAPLKALAFYTEKRMIATWRASLSEALITAYTSNRCYFHMQLARGTEGSPDSNDAGNLQQDNLQENVPASGTAASAAVLQAVELSGGPYAAAGLTNRSSKDSKDQISDAERARALAGTPSKPEYFSMPAPVPGLSGASACVDNPDQRITSDVANYVSTSVTLVHLLGKKLLNCAAFAGEAAAAAAASRMLSWCSWLWNVSRLAAFACNCSVKRCAVIFTASACQASGA
jgi:ABC-type uncharacterized transport system fused permease/ATPase subunit